MRLLIISLFSILNSVVFSSVQMSQDNWFPMIPNERLTPGDLCYQADSFRYPERIAYCERNVSKERKAEIFRTYDRELGFHTQEMDRNDFKIDHYIPLCMGGSNSEENLWPQHKSIWTQTDRLEETLCLLMAGGKLFQAKAVEVIRHVKQHPSEAAKYTRDYMSQLR